MNQAVTFLYSSILKIQTLHSQNIEIQDKIDQLIIITDWIQEKIINNIKQEKQIKIINSLSNRLTIGQQLCDQANQRSCLTKYCYLESDIKKIQNCLTSLQSLITTYSLTLTQESKNQQQKDKDLIVAVKDQQQKDNELMEIVKNQQNEVQKAILQVQQDFQNKIENKEQTQKQENINKDQFNKYKIKFVIIGDSGVGKTRIIDSYLNRHYVYEATMGADYCKKKIYSGNNEIDLQIWDTAGQERFRSISKIYYRNSDIIGIVFDLTNLQSFENLEYWIKEVQQQTEHHIYVIFANKCDYSDQVVTDEMLNQLKEQTKQKIFKTSALNNDGIQQGFNYMIDQYLLNKKYDNQQKDRSSSIRINDKMLRQNTQKNCCN